MTPTLDVSGFVRKWDLDEVAKEFMSHLPDVIQKDCVAHFAGGNDTRDVSRRFVAFARSRLNFTQNQNGPLIRTEVASFCESWGIKPHYSIAILLNQLPEKLFNETKANFAPRVQPRKPEALLKAFIESRALYYIPTFLEQHALGPDANSLIQRLNSEQLLDVICNFNPRGNTRNPTAMFISFANGRSKGSFSEGVQPSNARLNKFAKQWNIKREFVKNLLQHLDPILANAILTTFQVDNNTKNPENLFRGFVKSRVEGFAKKPHPSQQGWNYYGVHPTNMNDGRIVAYCAWLGLNAENTERVAAMSSTRLEAVMANFWPSVDTRNINSLFFSYVKLESNRVKEERDKELDDLIYPVTELAIFAAKWGLSPESRMLLSRLPFEVGRGLLSDFQPRQHIHDPDKFMATFIKNRCKSHVHAFSKSLALNYESMAALRNRPIEVICDIMASYEPVREVNCDAHFLAHVLYRVSRHSGDGKTIKCQRNKPGSLSPDATALVEFWQLNASCVRVLSQLALEDQDTIAKEFEPRTDVPNLSALFRKFLRLKTSPEPKWKRFAPISVAGFVRKFDLDTSSMEMMKKLTPEQQQDIINTFRPHAGVRNMDSLLKNYTQSRLERSGKTDSISLEHIPTIDDFLDKWGLGEEARDLMLSKDAEQQRHIILSFRPRRKNKVEELFLSYAQSDKALPSFGAEK
eukprot:GEMP01008981.1.p1 GENE.GEMP01008981.1~~GEMP01008981.1.p1  ORF type:complete len:691 (+),score=108.22 GEMP01008981.1:165-2237(+)